MNDLKSYDPQELHSRWVLYFEISHQHSCHDYLISEFLPTQETSFRYWLKFYQQYYACFSPVSHSLIETIYSVFKGGWHQGPIDIEDVTTTIQYSSLLALLNEVPQTLYDEGSDHPYFHIIRLKALLECHQNCSDVLLIGVGWGL